MARLQPRKIAGSMDYMPLQIFRRHTGKRDKGYRATDREHKDCRCKISVEGKLGDEFIRSSTGDPVAEPGPGG